MRSKITIEFTSVPPIGDIFSFSESLQDIVMNETFKALRTGSYQTKIPDGTDISIEGDPPFYIYTQFISQLYRTAFILDYNTTGLFTITATNGPSHSGLGIVIIEANYDNAVFELQSSLDYTTVTIENQDTVVPFTIDDVEFTEASVTPCSMVTISVTTSELIANIISPTIPGTITNPLVFDWPRNQLINLVVENTDGIQATTSIQTPGFLSSADFTVQVNNGPAGTTVIINNINASGLTMEYSLDNITFQTDNFFSGLSNGDYTVYVRDNFGCSFSQDFHIDEFGIQAPYFYISKANSFRFANRITWGTSSNYKTDENTLSCEVDVLCPFTEIQQFQSADVITTQFRSNYATNTAKLIKENGTIVSIPVVQKTTNIGIKDMRDARKYDLGSGKTGIYFTNGNVYDYTTSTVTGTHQLNGLLPEWGRIGNYFTIGLISYLIEEVIFDESKNADVLIISNVYSGVDASVIVGSIFNRYNYEVFEFTVDMVSYIGEYFRIQIENIDPHFTTLTHLSELIWCLVQHSQVLELRYRNKTNTDILYSTGIEHLIRIPYTYFKGKTDGTSEIHKTDTDAILLNADLYEGDEIVFEPVTKEIWRKIMIAISHEVLSINGVAYARNGDFSTEGPLEKSNLYVLTANVIKSSNVYNSQTTGNLGFDGSAVPVPGLIQSDSGYIEY